MVVAVADGDDRGVTPVFSGVAVVDQPTVHDGEAQTRVRWEGGGGVGVVDQSDKVVACRTTEGVRGTVVEAETVETMGVQLLSFSVSNRIDKSSVCMDIL